MKKLSLQPYIMFISSMLIFGTIGIFRKNIVMPSSMLALVRGILGSLFLFIFILLTKKPLFKCISRKNLFFLILLGIMIGLNWMFLFQAYNYTTVSVATLCYYMEPTIVMLASPFIFKEKLNIKKTVCVFLSVIGMLFVSGVLNGNNSSGADIRGIIFGLSAAVLYSAVVLLNKKVTDVDSYSKTIIQLFFAGIVLLPYVLFTENISNTKFNITSVILVLILGIVHTGIAYTLYFSSINKLQLQSVALLSYVDPVSALLLSALILHEQMTLWGFIGAVLIIGSAIASEFDFTKNRT